MGVRVAGEGALQQQEIAGDGVSERERVKKLPFPPPGGTPDGWKMKVASTAVAQSSYALCFERDSVLSQERRG